MRSSHLAILAAVSSLTSAHFNLDYPPARDFDEDKLVQFPCGSFNTPTSNRTTWPISGGEIALTMGHIDANVAVFLGLGSDPGSAFNTVLRPTFKETGLGSFCMTGFSVPSGLNITDGTLATIQVVTNGDPDGGLYNCADITFSSSAAAPASGVCTNQTGVTVSATESGLPNSTVGTATSTSASPTATKTNSAQALRIGGWGVLAAGGLVFAAAL